MTFMCGGGGKSVGREGEEGGGGARVEEEVRV